MDQRSCQDDHKHGEAASAARGHRMPKRQSKVGDSENGRALSSVARAAVDTAEGGESARLQRQQAQLRYEAAIANEELRQKIRRTLQDKVIEALGILLKGEKTVVERNKETGEVR